MQSHQAIHYSHIYTCEFCGETFPLRENYKEHRRLHKKEHNKEFSCGYCSEKMIMSMFREHISEYHMQLVFCCPICDLNHKSRSCLEEHLFDDHNAKSDVVIKVKGAIDAPPVQDFSDQCEPFDFNELVQEDDGSNLYFNDVPEDMSIGQFDLIKENLEYQNLNQSDDDLDDYVAMESFDFDELHAPIDQNMSLVEEDQGNFELSNDYELKQNLDETADQLDIDETESLSTTDEEPSTEKKNVKEILQATNEVLEELVEDDAQEGDDIADAEKMPFVCGFCPKTFSKKYNLQVHVRTIHFNDRKVFKCETCSKEVSSPFNLKKHIRNIHDKDFKCATCNSVFESRYFLDKHNLEEHVKGESYAINCKILNSDSESSKTLKLSDDNDL